MNCLRPDLIYEHLEGALGPARQAEVEAHLTRCPACRAAVEERRLIHRASFGLPDLDVPADFTHRVMARLDPGRSTAWAWLAAVVGSLAGIFMTFLAYVLITGQSLVGVLSSVLGTLGKGTQYAVVWLGKVGKLGAVVLPLLGDLGRSLIKAGGQLAVSAGPGFFIATSLALVLLMVLAGFGLGRKLFAGEKS
ncbi:MAG: zf-HC2 domain-containing protein [Candidatus Aminicenantes bacterium]|nr:zf-HC2 domain-containing protein [Candidatus Aminicenantes bacterium]